jgi:predicted dehydrogenase
MTRTIRWGIIGVGDVTEVKSGPGFQKAEHSALVAVMRRDGEKAADYARRHGVARWYDDAEALIQDAEVDAVYIATPPHVHAELTAMVAKAGKPVFVEKPMALNLAECEAMIEDCRRADVPLWVAYYRRRLPRFVKIKALLDEGAIGEIRTVGVNLDRKPMSIKGEIPWRVRPEIAGGGLFMDVGVHMLDLLDYFLGPIGEVTGFAANQAGLYAAEDNVVGSFVFESGVTGVGAWCFSAGIERDETLIVGSTGTIAYSNFGPEPIRVENQDGMQAFEIEHPAHVHQPLIQSIVDELLGQGMCPSTGESGARTARVTDGLLAGYYGVG